MPFSVTNPDFVAGTLIQSSQVDQNFADLVSAGNTHEAATTGIHGVGGGAIVGTTLTQTLTNKSLTSPQITGAGVGKATLQYANSATGRTLTIPDPGAADTIVALAATQTLTNKTLGSGTETTFPGWFNNIAIVRATTTNAGDSIKITSADGTAFSATNVGTITLPSTVTAGLSVKFSITADVTILLTGAHWGIGTTGDITGALLRVLAINDNGTLRWGVAYLGGRNTILTTDTSATQTDINLPEEVLTTAAVGSASNTCREVGFVRANFDDTGGAAEDLWAIQTGLNDVVTGQTADGYWQPWNPTFTGFAVNPTVQTARWTQVSRLATFEFVTSAAGTSNSVSFTSTLPVKCRTSGTYLAMPVRDNSVTLTTPGRLDLSAVGSNSINLYIDSVGNAWTNANQKYADYDFTMEVGPAASFIE